MKRLILPVKRFFNLRAYLILLGLLVLAELAGLPYSLTRSDLTDMGFWTLILGVSIDILLFAILGAAGLWLAGRIGLGMPFIEGGTNRKPLWNRLPGVVGISILAGFLLPLILVLDSALVSIIKPVTEVQAETVIDPPVWQGILVAFSAGITEETIYRLFGLTLLAWLGSLLFRNRTGQVAPWLLWTATILFAILFGLAHLPTARQMGIPIDAFVVLRTIIINGAGGLLFGWLYWSFGLESAMLAHISADLVVHGFVPLITQQTDPLGSIIAGTIFGLVWALAILWSVSAILRDRKQFPSSTISDTPLMEAGSPHPTV